MKDIRMYEGDIEIKGEDIVIEDIEGTLISLVRRAVITPLRYIGMYINDDIGVRLIDEEYGNGLYTELSEALNFSWLSRANSHLEQCLSFLPKEIRIQRADINIKGLDTVDVFIDYSIGDEYKQIVIGVNVNEG